MAKFGPGETGPKDFHWLYFTIDDFWCHVKLQMISRLAEKPSNPPHTFSFILIFPLEDDRDDAEAADARREHA